jgi:hypothetical protein
MLLEELGKLKRSASVAIAHLKATIPRLASLTGLPFISVFKETY